MASSTLSDFLRQALAALRILIVFTLIVGIGYPVAVWAVGRALGERTQGQPVRLDGQVVGSKLLGQDFSGDQWFHSRPSAGDYDSLASGPSNLGPSNPDLLASIEQRRTDVAQAESVSPSAVPPDALTASGSGLDPQISPAYAAIQAARVARVSGLSLADVEALVAQNTQGRFLSFHGEPGVNVLTLNVALEESRQESRRG